MLTTSDTPNIHVATEEPELPAMRGHLERAIAGASEYFDRAEHNMNVRYC